MSNPVVGELTPWVGVFPTEFREFNTPTMNGLAKITGSSIEIMSVYSRHPNKGHFREFVDDLKRNYTRIRFWALLNEDLVGTLSRYGFSSGADVDEYGEMTDLMDWKDPKLSACVNKEKE